MDITQYRKAIERTMNDELIERAKLSMLALGLAGETGEVVDQIKKHVYHGHELDRGELIKELGDLCWYLFHLMNHFDISEEEVFIKNIMKLQKRYSKGFSQEESKNRIEYKEGN
jgi:NTP pyrophosphatase (non-canonical NTP hydrolase)